MLAILATAVAVLEFFVMIMLLDKIAEMQERLAEREWMQPVFPTDEETVRKVIETLNRK